MTDKTLYALTGRLQINARNGALSNSTSRYEGKIYAIEGPGIASTTSTNVRLPSKIIEFLYF